MYNDHLKNNNTYKWLDNVKYIFDECGLSYIWRAQSVYGSKELICNRIEMSLKDQFKQKWHSAVTESPKCFNYKLLKTDHTYENFLDILPSAYLQKMINFRMCNNYLPIEKLRWAAIDRDHRKCM